jgi:ATP-dependent 26S proteasome regulatory subunit
MASISSKQQITELIKAGYVITYVVSSEESRVEDTIVDIATVALKKKDRNVIAWSCTKGFEKLKGSCKLGGDVRDPLKALDKISGYEGDAIFVLRDFHPYLKNPQVTRRLRDLNRDLKESGNDYDRKIILLSGLFNVPSEIEKDLAVVDFNLPDREEMASIVNEVVIEIVKEIDKENKDKATVDENKLRAAVDKNERKRVVDAVLGLSAEEAENALYKSFVRKKDLDIETLLEEKKNIIRKSGVLEFYESNEDLEGVGGLEVLKDWLGKRQRSFDDDAREFGLPAPKGILLLGIPGCGKSLSAKAIGHQWRVPLLRLDVGRVFAGLVGQSEENMRKAIKTAEAVAPCVLWLDELEKGFSGTASSGQTDGGTTSRVFASFITWLQEKQSPVFVIATANNVHQLPPELLRKGRFDEIFFVDLPTSEERKQIIRIHIQKKKRSLRDFDLDKIVDATQGFSGSEIEQAIISALYDAFEARADDPEADINTERVVKSCEEIIPLSYTMKEDIDRMREWAKSRARPASYGAAEQLDASAAGRKVEL